MNRPKRIDDILEKVQLKEMPHEETTEIEQGGERALMRFVEEERKASMLAYEKFSRMWFV